MATDAQSSSTAPGPANTTDQRSVSSIGHDYIRRKINSTRRSVKLAELAAGLLLFGAGSILFLLLLAVVDHWVVGLGFMSRLAAFLVYVTAAAAFLWIYVAPLLIHSINPLYAARMIEQGQPTLKNSLLNFLFLTQNQQGTRKAVLDAVETQAATDMSALKLEHLVDYTKAIRIGYVLAALAILFGLYKVISPKDPFQTALRVLAPWEEIARPSRVKIVDVQPGSTSIYQGESLEVSAKIYDAGTSDEIKLVFSTRDGQLVDQSIPMEVSNDGFTYQALLSTSENGIQQGLTYHIEAGDAMTRDFEVTTLEAPAIDVTSVRYDFPPYTGEEPYQREGDGHIRALENTMVTLRTVSNRPIQKAYLEFDPIEGAPAGAFNTLPLQVRSSSPTEATVRFPLELNEAGTAGKHRSYQVRFRTQDGVLNPHPVLHDIEVLRDLPPEVSWIEPTASEVELPANSSLRLKLRAIDPDFAIRQLHIDAAVEGRPLFDQTLLDEAEKGQVLEAWMFVPAKHDLEEGQVVKLIGIAEDTRTDHSGGFMPNRATTRPRIIRITAPVEGAQANDPAEGQDGGEDQKGEKSDDSQGDKSGDQGKQNKEGESGDESGEDPQSEGAEEGKGEEGSKQENSAQDGMKANSDEPKEGESSSEQQSEGGQGNSKSSDQQEGESNEEKQQNMGEGSNSEESPESGDPQQREAEPGQGGSSNSQEQSGDENSESKGSGGEGGKASAKSDGQDRPKNESNQAGDPSGNGTGKPGDPNKGGELQKGDSSTQPNENSTVERKSDPVASDGSEDGDAFEKLQDYLKKKEQEEYTRGDQPMPENADPQEAPQNGPQTGGNQTSGDKKPSDPSGEDNAGTGQGNQQSQENQQDQDSGNSPSGESSSGQQNGQKPDKGGIDNGKQPESKAGGENASETEKQDGEPGTNDLNEGQSAERDTQNNDAGVGQNKGGATNQEDKVNETTDSERAGDKGAGDNTDSGSGEPGNEGEKGSPDSNPERSNKQRKNNTEAEEGKSDEEGDAPKSPSNSDQQSASKKGGERGEESGDGKTGGGQSAQQAGNDSAGSTSAGDEGAGKANQQGQGETGQEGGNGPQADKKTGSSGKEKGEGSQTKQSPSGQETESEGAEGDNSPEKGPQSDPTQSGRGPGNTPNPQGGGKPGDNAAGNFDGPLTEPGEDAANVEYAKQATDMVLDRLKHQEGNPDQEMLDELGWSKEDFQKFVQRWQKMKQAAQTSEPGAKRELNEALRSLGLSRGADRTRRVEARRAAAGGSGDTQRSTPPPAFLEQYRAYLKGASQ